jgi:hypothetical protein
MMAEVVTLYQNNFRDPVFSLRAIADEIDEGKYGEVGCVGIVVMGDTTEVFGERYLALGLIVRDPLSLRYFTRAFSN